MFSLATKLPTISPFNTGVYSRLISQIHITHPKLENLYRQMQDCHINDRSPLILQGPIWYMNKDDQQNSDILKKSDNTFKIIESIQHPFDQESICYGDEMIQRIIKEVVTTKYEDQKPENFNEPFFGYITRSSHNIFFQKPDSRINLMDVSKKDVNQYIGKSATEILENYKQELETLTNQKENSSSR